MKLFFIFISALCLSSTLALSQEDDENQRTFDIQGDQWIMKMTDGADDEHPKAHSEIIVSSKNTQEVLMSFEASDSKFRDAEVVTLAKYPRPLLVTQWSRGMHSGVLRIFDPSLKENSRLATFDSISQVYYKVSGDHLDIEQIQFKSKKDSKLISMRSTWRPSEITRASKTSNPPAPQNQ